MRFKTTILFAAAVILICFQTALAQPYVLVCGSNTSDTPANWGGVIAIDKATNAQVGSLDISPLNCSDLALSPDGKTAYVLGRENGNSWTGSPVSAILIVTVPSLTVTGRVPLGDNFAIAMAMTRDGSRAYVAGENSFQHPPNFQDGSLVTQVDLVSASVVNSALFQDGPIYFYPYHEANIFGIAVSPDGARVYVNGHILDGASLQVIGSAPFGDFRSAATPSVGNSIYINNLVYDTLTNSVIAALPVGAAPWPGSMAVSADGSSLFMASDGAVLNIIDTTSSSYPVTAVSLPFSVTAVGISSDGSVAYVAGPGNLADVDISSRTVIGNPLPLPFTWELTSIKVTPAPKPRYSVCLLYDPTKAVHSGGTTPIKLQLCDSAGNNLSSPAITIHATSESKVSASISGPVQDSGNANPDNNFRFDSTLGITGGYIFNLKTTGLSTGTYNLNFTVSDDSFMYVAPFQVK